MQLSFMRQWPDTKEPTLFLEMIWMGLLENSRLPGRTTAYHHYQELHRKKYGKEMTLPWGERKPKLHTIRKAGKRVWETKYDIQFITGNRYQKGGGGLFQFAPLMKPAKVQDIFMTATGPHGIEVSVDDRYMYYPEIKQLAINDGFTSVEGFRDYFFKEKNEEYSGQLIHWTNLSY